VVVLTVSVELPEALMEPGLKLTLLLEGRPVTLNDTLPPKPLREPMVAV